MSNNRIDVAPGKLAAVVTSLEMFSRPVFRPEHPDPGWHLHHVQQADLPWFRDLFRRVGLNWLWFSRLQMSDTTLALLAAPPRLQAAPDTHREQCPACLEFRVPSILDEHLASVPHPIALAALPADARGLDEDALLGHACKTPSRLALLLVGIGGRSIESSRSV
jgi:hypothetical protein